jgi:hypothetical protein
MTNRQRPFPFRRPRGYCCPGLSPGAGVVKLVNTRDLKSLGFGFAGSSPAARTIFRYPRHIPRRVFLLFQVEIPDFGFVELVQVGCAPHRPATYRPIYRGKYLGLKFCPIKSAVVSPISYLYA